MNLASLSMEAFVLQDSCPLPGFPQTLTWLLSFATLKRWPLAGSLGLCTTANLSSTAVPMWKLPTQQGPAGPHPSPEPRKQPPSFQLCVKCFPWVLCKGGARGRSSGSAGKPRGGGSWPGQGGDQEALRGGEGH